MHSSHSDINSDEENNTNRVGLPSINNYYSKYKDIHKNIENQKHFKQAPFAYLKKCEDI